MPWSLREAGPSWDCAWDALAGGAPESGFMQSSAWAAFKRLEGYETLRLGLFDGETLLGGASLLFYPAGLEGGLILCPEGPVLPWGDVAKARDGLRRVIEASREWGGSRDAVGLRIEPHLVPPATSLLRNWTRAPVDLTPLNTLMVDLAPSDAEIRARMRPKARYNLGLAERHGVRVSWSSDVRDLASFYPLFAETARRNDFYAEPYGFFLNLGATLFPRGRAAVFRAEWREEIIAAIVVVFYGLRATYLYGGSSAVHREVMPNYALHWAAISQARTRGCREYDLYGYDPFGLPGHQYAGISRFKKQLGGERRDWIGARDLIFYDRLADRVIDHLARS